VPVIPERMRDARDAEDAQLLEDGDHVRLLAAYHDVVLQRCLVRVPGDAAYDVAQNVYERLWGELQRGRRYTVPYRVVVHNVVTWTIQEHFQGLPTDIPLPDGWDPAAVEHDVALGPQLDLAALFSQLPAGDAAVCRLRYMVGKEIDEIATELGKQRNAVDQALWRAHKRLRELIGAA
jgi:DNA-directed RNA polymerase specialized sigma24 family protein